MVAAGVPAGYDAVVLDPPMIFAWHRQALRYLKAQRHALAKTPGRPERLSYREQGRDRPFRGRE